MLLAALLDVGVPYEYLEKMTKRNPVQVLGLESGWTPAVVPSGSASAAGTGAAPPVASPFA